MSGFGIDLGWLIRLNQYTGHPIFWEPATTTINYQAGYAIVPPDVVDAALRAITARFSVRGRDPLMKSQDQPGLGHQVGLINGES
jgi:hypothetical protein